MQRSDKVKTFVTRGIKIVLFLAIVIAINTLICQYLSPSAHKSNEMWAYYYSKDNADTLFIGTSVTDMIKEYSIDEFTGRSSVNMGTPSQYFATSRKVMEISTRERPIDTVVLMMGFDALERDEDLKSTLSIEKAYYDNKKVPDKLLAFISDNLKYSFEKRNISDPASINKWMSWPVNCIVDFDEIKNNLEKKAYYKDFVDEQKSNTVNVNSLMYLKSSMPKPGKLNDEIKLSIADIDAIDVSEESLIALKQMCEYCNANGIMLIVAVSPHMSGYADSFEGDYDKINELTKNFVESQGCLYINLNDLPSVQAIMTDEYFTDSEHVTHDGIELASGVMSDILNLLTGKRGDE